MPTSKPAVEATRAEPRFEAKPLKRESWRDGGFTENAADRAATHEQFRSVRESHGERFMKRSERPSPLAALNRMLRKRYGHIRFRLLDFCCLGYMALIGLLLPLFHRQVPHWPSDFLIHVLFVIAGLEIIRLAEKRPQNKLLWAIRTFYPVAFYGYGYGEIDHTVRMLLGSYWAIDFLLNLDKAIFGVHPTIWVQQFYSPWLDELMNFFYAGYYFFPALIALPLFLRKKSEETLAAFSIVTFVYFSNYLLFYIFPTLSPRHIPGFAEMHTAEYTGYFIASFNRFVQSFGSVHGGCFPSSHVSGALAWSLVACRYNRKLGYLFFPMSGRRHGLPALSSCRGPRRRADLGLCLLSRCPRNSQETRRRPGQRVAASS
jgi:hypothetical protein